MNEDELQLIRMAADGDAEAWQRLIEQNRPRIRRMVQLRLDPRLSARVDPSDILQEAFVEAFQRLERYLDEQPMPFFLWLRYLAGQQMLMNHLHHLGRQKRSPEREVHQGSFGGPPASSQSIVRHLIGNETTPSRIVVQLEEERLLREAIESLQPDVRELLALRHFEHLTNAEASIVLGLNESTASTKYLRALRQLKVMLPSSEDD